MNTISRALLFLLTLALASTSQAQVDVAVQGVLPLSNVRLFAGQSVPVTVGILNLGPSIVQATQVKVTIRTYTNIILYADSVIVSGVHNYLDSVKLRPFLVTETGFYSVSAKVTTKDDKNIENNSYSNPRVSWQADPAILGIITPILNDVKLQKVTFPLRGKFRSNSFNQELEVRARVEIRRCLDSALMFAADDIIPELPKDTVSVLFDFPTKQGIYDVRKLDPGCYFVTMMTRSTADFNHGNDALTNTFSIQANTLPNDVLTDAVNSIKDKTIKPNEELPMHFLFGNVGSNAQASMKVHVVITNEDRAEVYHQQDTLNNFYSFESRAKDFPAFKTSIGGTYKLRAYTALPNDEYRYNDTVTATITVEKLFRIIADTVLMPAPGQAFAVGTTFVPKARFSWTGNAVPTGNLKAVLVLKSKTGSPELPFLGTFAAFSESSRTIDINFPTPMTGRKWSELVRGEYTATASALIDDKAVSISSPIPFRMADQHDVRLDTTVSPVRLRSYPISTILVDQEATNSGMMDEPQATLDAVITDRKGVVVYHEITSKAIGVLEKKHLLLPDFTPASKGMYEATFQIDVPNETNKSDNTILRHRFHVGSIYDAVVDSAINPKPNAKFARGSGFIPAFFLDWLGVDTVHTQVPLELRIVRCEDNAQVFHQSQVTSFVDQLPRGDITMSETSTDGTRIRDLAAGCYKAVFMALHPEEGDRSDDTLVVPFSIEESSGVLQQDASFAIESISHEGNAIVARLSGEAHALPYRLYDICGSVVRSGMAFGDRLRIPMDALVSGSYILELQSGDAVLRRQINYLK